MTNPSAEVKYHVVVNHEAQYSIWPVNMALPAGWTIVGEAGDKNACLDYIKQVWTDMRPLSLIKELELLG